MAQRLVSDAGVDPVMVGGLERAGIDLSKPLARRQFIAAEMRKRLSAANERSVKENESGNDRDGDVDSSRGDHNVAPKLKERRSTSQPDLADHWRRDPHSRCRR
ncbi:MAG TPA: hypothetical protein VNQ76_22905, partial [Planctomicrobium sp.]|nr:hypothetical protein [Planctomicrobium sp.]